MRKRGRPASKYRTVFWESLPKSTQRPIGEILSEIDAEVKRAYLSVGRDDGSEIEALSVAIAKLPAFMKGLGYYLADAENEANVTKDDFDLLKAQKEKGVIDTGVSVAVAERTAATDSELVLKKDLWRKAQHNYKILKLQWDSTDKQVTAFQSRLKVAGQDLRAGE